MTLPHHPQEKVFVFKRERFTRHEDKTMDIHHNFSLLCLIIGAAAQFSIKFIQI